ncbi:MAG: GNAT family N-acetyltransferase [Gammaproteobacteria bacterium]|nr:GNAT family N-acetyltransferase [Gammaproteobacteria bacterium]
MFWRSWQELSKQELYDLLQLRLAVFSVEQDCPYQDCDDLDQEAYHLLAYQDSKLIGYLRVFESSAKYQGAASIGRVCCCESVRGSGFGKKMMLEAIKYCDENFQKKISISAQAYLRDFYHELGFDVASVIYLEDGIEHIKMVREFS